MAVGGMPIVSISIKTDRAITEPYSILIIQGSNHHLLIKRNDPSSDFYTAVNKPALVINDLKRG